MQQARKLGSYCIYIYYQDIEDKMVKFVQEIVNIWIIRRDIAGVQD